MIRKRALFALWLVPFVSWTAFAGLPEEDPLVQNLRQRFESGYVPFENDILNKTFACKDRYAMKGNFTVVSFQLSFKSFEDMIVQIKPGAADDQLLLADVGKELMGVMAGPVNNRVSYYVAYRMDRKRMLIGEWSIVVPSGMDFPMGAEAKPVAAAVPQGARAVSYTICIPLHGQEPR